MPKYIQETETNLVFPPTFGGDQCAPKVLPFSAGISTSALDIGFSNTWVTLTASEDCYIRFSDTAGLSAATVNDWPVWQGAYLNFFVGVFQFIRVMGGSSPGIVTLYQSSR